jgi:predicted nucleic acid-binding Zn ribbon protein
VERVGRLRAVTATAMRLKGETRQRPMFEIEAECVKESGRQGLGSAELLADDAQVAKLRDEVIAVATELSLWAKKQLATRPAR